LRYSRVTAESAIEINVRAYRFIVVARVVMETNGFGV
jgi:hypothetical protein